jgi:hypothetical protein
MGVLRTTQCDNPLTNRGPRSQRPGFAKSETPDDMGTFRESDRTLRPGVELTEGVHLPRSIGSES